MSNDGCKVDDLFIGFSTHRPEIVPLAAEQMARFDLICLEEPPSESFLPMLRREIAVEDYLLELDLEYPEFSRRMCRLLRDLHDRGKRVVQVEPFLEHLLAIHERFAAGEAPDDLPRGTPMFDVYEAEREATAALLAFYTAAAGAGFDRVIAAVKRFARSDARRFLLRDRMRARAIAPLISEARSSYVEAGQMHFALQRFLRRILPGTLRVVSRFLAAPQARAFGGPAHLYGPGDVLTLLYLFHPERDQPREDLLAARALVYNKIIEKEESEEGSDGFFHTKDEIQAIRTVRPLSVEDCRTLYPVLRRAGTAESRQAVKDYLRSQRKGRKGAIPPPKSWT